MDGIVPEYQGKHIFSMLEAARMNALYEIGINTIRFDTAEKNTKRQKIAKKFGFSYVDFFASYKINHFSVVMFKWLGERPYSQLYCLLKYYKRKIYIKTKYKVGKEKRFR